MLFSWYRPIMFVALLEKSSYGLFSAGRSPPGRTDKGQLFFACIELVFGVVFLVAFAKLRNRPAEQRTNEMMRDGHRKQKRPMQGMGRW